MLQEENFIYLTFRLPDDVSSSQTTGIVHDLTQDDSNGLDVDCGSSPDIEMLEDIPCDPNKDSHHQELDSSSLVSLTQDLVSIIISPNKPLYMSRPRTVSL